MSPRSNVVPSHYKTMDQADVPQGRHGKHKEVVTAILKDLDNLKDGSAIKIPPGGFGGKQREGPFSPESCHSESWAERRNRQRRQLPVCLERNL